MLQFLVLKSINQTFKLFLLGIKNSSDISHKNIIIKHIHNILAKDFLAIAKNLS